MSTTTQTDNGTAQTEDVRSGSARRPPGPRGLPVLGYAHRLAADPYTALPTLAREYGDVVSVPLPGIDVILVSHPEYANHIFNRHTSRYAHHHDAVADALLPGDPPALPMREGADWKRVRKLLTPRFSEGSLAGLSDRVTDAVTESIDRWEPWAGSGRTIELQHELGVVVMSALVRSMFSDSLDREAIERLVRQARTHGEFIARAGATFLAQRALPFGGTIHPARVPWPHLRAGMANYRAIRDDVDRLITDRREHPTDDTDLLNLLLEAKFEDGSGFEHDALRSELIGLLFAGFETTAAALAWTISLLARHRSVMDDAYAEVDALGDVRVGHEHLEQLPFLRACFDEGQRIQGAPLNGRFAKHDDEIGGYFIPEGAWVVVSVYGMHHDARFWTNPQQFNPRRFLDDEINKYAFMPFGVGPRRCLGMRLAYLEGLITLATALQQFRFVLPFGWEPERRFHLSTGMAELPVVLQRRVSA